MTGSHDVERALRAQLNHDFLTLDADPTLADRVTASVARTRRRRSVTANVSVVVATAAAIGGWWLWTADDGSRTPDPTVDPTTPAVTGDCSGVRISATGGGRVDLVVMLTNEATGSDCVLSDLRLTVSADDEPSVDASTTADAQAFDDPATEVLSPGSGAGIAASLGPADCASTLNLLIEFADATMLTGQLTLNGPACSPALTELVITSVAGTDDITPGGDPEPTEPS